MSVAFTESGQETFHLVSANTTNATVIKAAEGSVYSYHLINSNVAARKVAFHNAASTPTAGADVFFSVLVPATSSVSFSSLDGIRFDTGIAITTVTEIADNGTTAVGAGDLIINIFYR